MKATGVSGFSSMVLLAICFVFAATGCAFAQERSVRLGVARECLSALAYIAQEKGLFAKNGLNVTVREYASGKLALDALFAGEVDAATVAETPLVFGSLKRQDFGIIATIGATDNEPSIVARKDRGILKGVDLKGKRIATQKASAVHYFLHLFLLKNGLSEKDVKAVFRRPDEMVNALVQGECDAMSMREPLVSEARRLLGENAVVLSAPGLYQKTMNITAMQGFIRNRQADAQRLLLALAQAEAVVKKDEPAAIRIVAKRLGVEESTSGVLLKASVLRLGLDRSLLLLMEEEARWAVSLEASGSAAPPNLMNIIRADALTAVKPNAVTIAR